MDRADREQRNARIVELYFEKHQSREEIAHLIGLSYAHVCRIIKAATEGVKPRYSLNANRSTKQSDLTPLLVCECSFLL